MSKIIRDELRTLCARMQQSDTTMAWMQPETFHQFASLLPAGESVHIPRAELERILRRVDGKEASHAAE